MALHWFRPLHSPWHYIVFWKGIVLIVIGGSIAVWGKRTMERAGTNINPSKPTTAIVTGGPFRYSRNPLYLAVTLIFLGISLIIDTWWGIIVIVPVLLILHFGVVLREERYLERKFGGSYLQYKRTVRRYL
jgi:protein-S-isoprenylcysteine O-methyltransferase Ste14